MPIAQTWVMRGIPGGSERNEVLDMCHTVYMPYCSYVVFQNLV